VIRLELAASDERRYVSRTLEGPGAASEIWTRLDPVDARHTDIEVEFLVPGVGADRRDALGAAYVALYTRLWDQDEAMMQRRSFLLDAPRPRRAAREPVDLGPAAELERACRCGRVRRPPRGGRALWGELLAYDALCPHALGPLDDAPLARRPRRVPWHGKAVRRAQRRGCGARSAHAARARAARGDCQRARASRPRLAWRRRFASQEIELAPRSGIIGIEAHGRFQVLGGSRTPPLTHEQDGQVVVEVCVLGLELDRAHHFADRVGQLAFRGEQTARPKWALAKSGWIRIASE
jgi:hypothetical protein